MAYAAWIALAIIGFWLIFRLRMNLLDLLTFILEDPDTAKDAWIARAIDRWFIMVAGAAWVFCITLIEGYFRNSIPQNRLAVRLTRAGLVVAVIIAISYGLQALT